MTAFPIPTLPNPSAFRAIFDALYSSHIAFEGMIVHVPGPLPIRLSVVMGNLRMQRMLARLLRRGETVIDVGANIGYNTLFAAKCVGPTGRVIAIEPAQDNLAILYANLFANRLSHVAVMPFAAGRTREVKQFFLRGEISAVNSLYQDNFYHPITQTVEVLAMPLDDLVLDAANLVKIDVEGGELEVLQGMPRLLQNSSMRLIVEWHPTLQQAAGHAPDDLPRHLHALGFALRIVTHTQDQPLHPHQLAQWTSQLLHDRSPVELLATR